MGMIDNKANAFIGENAQDTNDRVRSGLALLKQTLTDETEQGCLTLNQSTLSGIYWLLTSLESALDVGTHGEGREPKVPLRVSHVRL